MTAYEGNENYIFVSYAHKDADRVIPIIEALNDAGFRIWYDSGIEVASEWPAYIQDHLMRSNLILAFISPFSVASPNCRNEINLALKYSKNMLIVYLEPTQLRDGMDLQLNSVQAVNANLHPNTQSLVGALCRAKILQCCNVAWDGTEQPETTTYVPPVSNRYDTDLLELRSMTDELESLWHTVMDLTRWLSNMPDESIFHNVQEIRLNIDKWNEGKRKFDQFLQESSCMNDALFKRTSVRFQECYERIHGYLPILEELEQLTSIQSELLSFQKNPEYMLTSTAHHRFAGVKPNLQRLLRPDEQSAIALCQKHQNRGVELRKLIDEAADAYDQLPTDARQKTFSVVDWAEGTSSGRVTKARDAADRYLSAAKKAIQVYGRTPEEQLPLKSVYGRKQLFDDFNANANHWTTFRENCTLYLEQEPIRNSFRAFSKLPVTDASLDSKYHNLMDQYKILSGAKARQIPQALVAAAEQKYSLYKHLKTFHSHVADATAAYKNLPAEVTKPGFSVDNWFSRVGDLKVREAKKHADAYLNAVQQATQVYQKELEGRLSLQDIPGGQTFFMQANASADVWEQFRSSCALYLGQDVLRSGMQAFLKLPLGDKGAQGKYQHLMSQYQRLSRAEAAQIPAALMEEVSNRWEAQRLFLEISVHLQEAMTHSKRLPAGATGHNFSVSNWADNNGPNAVKEALKNAQAYLAALEKARQIYDAAPVGVTQSLISAPGCSLITTQYSKETASWNQFAKNCTYCLELVDTRKRFQSFIEMSSDHPDFQATCLALQDEYTALPPAKLNQLPGSLVSAVKNRFTVYPLLMKLRPLYDSYLQIPEYIRIERNQQEFVSEPLAEAFRQKESAKFLEAVNAARDWTQQCRPVLDAQTMQKAEQMLTFMSPEDQNLYKKISVGLKDMNALLGILGSDKTIAQIHQLWKQMAPYCRYREPAYLQLPPLYDEFTKVCHSAQIRAVFLGSSDQKLQSLMEEVKAISRIAKNIHDLAEQVQPVNFQTFDNLSSVMKRYEPMHSSVSEKVQSLQSYAKHFTSSEMKEFMSDAKKLTDFYADMKECDQFHFLHRFAVKYKPLHQQKHPTLSNDYALNALEARWREYRDARSKLQRFDTENTVRKCFEAVEKDFSLIKKLLHKGDHIKITIFVILEVLTFGIACLPRLAANHDLVFWWIIAFIAATIASSIALSCVPRVTGRGVAWAWVPNVMYLIGAVGSVALYEAGAQCWYLTAFAAGLFGLMYLIISAKNYDTSGYAFWGFIILCVVALLLIVLWGGKVITCFQTTEFLEPGFFRSIANLFIGLWCIIKGLVLGLLQVLMLFIGGGFWNPGFYAGFFIGAPLLNTIFYTLLILCITSFIKSDL